jgi:hypothetical protein
LQKGWVIVPRPKLTSDLPTLSIQQAIHHSKIKYMHISCVTKPIHTSRFLFSSWVESVRKQAERKALVESTRLDADSARRGLSGSMAASVISIASAGRWPCKHNVDVKLEMKPQIGVE